MFSCYCFCVGPNNKGIKKGSRFELTVKSDQLICWLFRENISNSTAIKLFQHSEKRTDFKEFY